MEKKNRDTACCKPHHGMNMCCCNCKYLIADMSHPDTDGKSILSQRGWICVGFLFCEGEAVGFSGWSEHGLCELWTEKVQP